MTMLYVTFALAAAASAGLKAAGPMLLGGRELPSRARAVVALLAPALLASLVVVQTFATGQRLVLDARALGVFVAAAALALRAPPLLAVASAIAVAAAARLLW